MNTRVILVVGVLAVIVSIAGLYALLGPAQGEGVAVRLLRFVPSSVVEVEVRHVGGIIERVTLDGGAWNYSREGAAGTWPVEGGNIRGALRVLATLRAPINTGAAADARGAEVVLKHADGATDTIMFGMTSVGGSVAVQVNDGASAFVDETIRDAFFEPGPSGWRVLSAMPGVTANASRIELLRGEAELSLARIGARWQLTSPIAHRADQQRVDALLRDILGIRGVRFLDSAEDREEAQGALLEPVLVLEVSTDTRVVDASGEISVARAGQTLLVADHLEGDGFVAHNLAHNVVLAVDDEHVRSIMSLSAASLLDATACGSLLADVAGVEFDRPGLMWRYTRTIDGWSSQVDTPEMESAAIEMFLGFLTDAPASSVRISPMPALESWADITLFDLGQNPLETITVGVDSLGMLYAAVTTLDQQTIVLMYDQSLPTLLERFFSR